VQYRALNEQQREARRLEIDPLLRNRIADWPCHALQAALESKGVAFGPVIHGRDVLGSPQVVHRGMVTTAGGPLAAVYVKQPVLFDGANFDLSRPPPALGEHTEEVLAGLRSQGAC
jgi:crotonobetainyl-CoA:carnitine CoA-transferase CaiB-like acyl-CoA transferase